MAGELDDARGTIKALEAMKVSTDKVRVRELLTRSIAAILPSTDALEKRLRSGERLRVYLGIDPTSPHLHLGHAVALLTLHRFQKLGHEVILLVGDFTARIGDPTDKLSSRQPLSEKEVAANMRTFKKQATKLIAFAGKNPARLAFNSTWHDKMKFGGLISLAQKFTVQQMLKRDMFKKRLSFTFECSSCKNVQVIYQDPFNENGNINEEGKKEFFKDRACEKCGKINHFGSELKEISAPKPIGLHEFLYPLMQGYDSVALDVDVEVGGNDQLFNMLAGRTLMSALKQKEKFVVTTKLLVDASTGKKLSKTEQSLVNLDEEPNNMFGKVMALPDRMIPAVAELSTTMPMDEVKTLSKEQNPRDAKLTLAHEVVSLYHSPAKADAAKEKWIKTFSEKSAPTDAPELQLARKEISALDLVLATGIKSKSEARRLITQSAVELDGKVLTDSAEILQIKSGAMLRIGKHRFWKLADGKGSHPVAHGL
ncbi:MAG: tyrosine--tRNA ligase [bacterium]|nr:tyrosine--tRNA ligase [bacterium]